MSWQAQCYPATVDDLKPVLALVQELGADHVNLQADVRPYRLEECVPYIDGWRRLAAEAGVPGAYRDASRPHDHRPVLHPASAGRFPDLRLTADLSHYLVGREFAWPIAPEEPRHDPPHSGQ